MCVLIVHTFCADYMFVTYMCCLYACYMCVLIVLHVCADCMFVTCVLIIYLLHVLLLTEILK